MNGQHDSRFGELWLLRMVDNGELSWLSLMVEGFTQVIKLMIQDGQE